VEPARQLGLLWGAVALLLVALSPMAPALAASLPSCPARSLLELPCPTCGSTRAALALRGLDLRAAVAASPLAALGWIGLVGGGLVAGLLALLGRPLEEPAWIESSATRWLLVATVLANWVYLIRAGL
jgi:hypothetical protein